MIRIVSKSSSCLSYSCSQALWSPTFTSFKRSQKPSHWGTSIGSAYLCNCARIKLFTSFSWVRGASDSCAEYFAYISRATCSLVSSSTSSRNIQDCWDVQQRLLVCREGKHLTNAAYETMSPFKWNSWWSQPVLACWNNTGQVVKLPGSDCDELTHLSGSAILAAEFIQIKPIIF